MPRDSLSDCLETLEEIALDARAAFLKAGGAEFHAFLAQRAPGVDCSAADLALEKTSAAGSICPRCRARRD